MLHGVKQGGIISPVLLNVYKDDLSTSLNNSGIGGYIGEKTINHLCYADDICLIALSSSAMQQLLNICHTYSTEHSLLYNQWCSGNFSLVGTLTWHYGHIHYHYRGGGGVPE